MPMYTAHFRLTAEPFALTPDPRFLYLSRGHTEALAALRVGLTGRRGLMVMTGEVGTGKTTLLYALLHALPESVRSAYVANTTLGFPGVLRLALDDFGVTAAAGDGVDMLRALNGFLRGCAETGDSAVLIVDEAHGLPDDAFEQLRQLSNFETFSHKLLQIVLVGQPELEARLAEPGLRALADRVAVHCRLTPLGLRESRAYIDHRLRCAGRSAEVFDPEARDLLLHASAGVPRRINMLCDTALLFAYGRGAERVVLATARAAIESRAAGGRHRTFRTAWQALAPWMRRAAEAGRRAADAMARAWSRSPRLAHWSARARAWRGWGVSGAPATVGLAIGILALAVAIAAAGVRVGTWLAARERIVTGAVARPGAPAARSAGDELAAADRALDAAPLPAAAPPPAPNSAMNEPDTAPTGAAEADPILASPRGHGGDGAAAAPVNVDAGDTLGLGGESAEIALVRVAPGSTLSALARRIYGEADPGVIRHIQRANPQVVNPNLIVVGDVLRFPQLGSGAAGEAGRDDR